MIEMPVSKIIDRICDQKGLTEADVQAKIKKKLEQLSGLISEAGAAHIIANELGVKLFDGSSSGPVKIENLFPGMKNASFDAKVIKKYELRNFDTGKRKGKVANALMGDETGIIRAVFWNDQTDMHEKLNEGDTVKIDNAYIRKNNDRSEVHFNEQTKIDINPTGVAIEVKPASHNRKMLNQITPEDSNVEVLGTIVQVYDPRFFEMCSICNKRAKPQEGVVMCPEHGEVKPIYNYVMNLFLDDGTNNMRVVLWKNQIQTLLSLDDPKIQEIRENPDKFEEKKMELLGHIVKIRGRVNHNEQFERLEIVCDFIDTKPDPDKELKQLEETSNNSTITQETTNSTDSDASESSKEETIETTETSPKTDEEKSTSTESEPEAAKVQASKEESTEKSEDKPKDDPVSLDDLEDIEEEFI